MRLVILTAKNQIYSPFIIKQLLPDNQIAGVFTSFLSGPKKSFLQNIRFAARKSGWLYVFLRGLDVLHNHFLALFNPHFQTIEKFCQKNRIAFYDLKDINSEGAIRIIKNIKADIIISLFSSQILKKEILSLPKYCCFNVHRAPLPKYRGPNSTFWQLANNKKMTGTTIHYIDEGIDTGDILLQTKYPILKNDTHHSLCLKNVEAVNSKLPQLLKSIEKNKVKAVKQNPNQASIYPFPTPQAVKNFFKHRKRMF